MNYTPIFAEGYFKDNNQSFKYSAAIGQYDGSFDDEHIFYWFDDFDKVIGEHEDFVITKYSINTTEDTIKHIGFFFDELLNDIDDKLIQLNNFVEKENNGIFSKSDFLDFISLYTDWNICDKCGRIAKSDHLKWLEYIDSREDRKIAEKILSNMNATAICKECWEEFKKELS